MKNKENLGITDMNTKDKIKLRERFCKDTNTPIKIFIEPYFSYRLDLFNPMFGSRDKYDNFMREIEGFEHAQDYFEFYNTVKDNAIKSIKSKVEYEEFIEYDVNNFKIKDEKLLNIRRKDIYKAENHGKTFISIDLAKANYTALRWFNPDIVDRTDMYEQFIRQFCGNGFKHIINSKYIRQVIFGNCNPKRQVTVEKFLMSLIIERAVLEYFDYDDIETFQSDEVVLKVDDEITLQKYADFYETMMRTVVFHEDIDVHLELFKLYKIENTPYYYKKFLVGGRGKDNIELKCVDGEMMPFVLRALYEEKVEEEDKVLMHNGLLAKLLEIPEITF